MNLSSQLPDNTPDHVVNSPCTLSITAEKLEEEGGGCCGRRAYEKHTVLTAGSSVGVTPSFSA